VIHFRLGLSGSLQANDSESSFFAGDFFDSEMVCPERNNPKVEMFFGKPLDFGDTTLLGT
jgi:hypothetical protein